MKAFTQLFTRLDRTTRTSLKVAALEDYFRAAPPADAAWALWVLSGARVKRSVHTGRLREWVADAARIPLWLVEESYDAVGDLAETLALLLPEPPKAHLDPPALHQVMDDWILPLRRRSDPEKQELLQEAWDRLDPQQRLVFHKLITGGFRVGVGRKLVTRALASVVGMEPAVLAHRTTGRWEPTAQDFRLITSPEADLPDPGQPYPFLLANPLEGGPAELPGPLERWQVEWKWDGIRGQLILRDGEVLVWSRGEELVTPTFPEVAEGARILPPGTVLDGELLAWKGQEPLPFHQLQRRLGRKRVGRKLLGEVPVTFLAYDLLEDGGEDLREKPLKERRRRLEELFSRLSLDPPAEADPTKESRAALPLALSPLVRVEGWDAAAELRGRSRELGREGLMLKDRESAYGVGRIRGPWWKWKVDPLSLDGVLMYAQRGHGRRASLYTDYTFGVWDGDDLVPVGKAYSGLSDAEIREVDRWIRGHVIDRFGPVRAVEPGLVFELAFDGIRPSSRHRSGVALRFPRMARWRRDKPPSEADTLPRVLGLLQRMEGAG
jgi:DNA ligase 1